MNKNDFIEFSLLVLLGVAGFVFTLKENKLFLYILIVFSIVFSVYEIFATVKYKFNLIKVLLKLLAVWSIPIALKFCKMPSLLLLSVSIIIGIYWLIELVKDRE